MAGEQTSGLYPTAATLAVHHHGTLAVIQLARAAHAHHGLRRFSAVSTVSVAGFRHDTVVTEDEELPGNRYDNDPYGLSKQCYAASSRDATSSHPIAIHPAWMDPKSTAWLRA